MGVESGSTPPQAELFEAPSSHTDDQEESTENLDKEAEGIATVEGADTSSKAEAVDATTEVVEPISENPEAVMADAIRLARERGLPNEALMRLNAVPTDRVLDLETRIKNSPYAEKSAAELLAEGAKDLSDKPRLADDGYTPDELAKETYTTLRDDKVRKHKRDVWEVTGFKMLPREYQSRIEAEINNLEAASQRHSANIADLEAKLADGEAAGLDQQTKTNLERRLVVEQAKRDEAESVVAVLRENM